MNPMRALAILLIVAGTLALIYGGFNYTRDTHAIDLGPLQLQVQEQSYQHIPIWAGVASLIGGIVLLGAARKAR